eukprot:scaffold922_cov220-Prasinococcus_capsulatus_cf.AAC.1
MALLDAGADLWSIVRDETSAFEAAVRKTSKGHLQTLALLLQFAAETSNESMERALVRSLHWASAAGNARAIRALTKAGVNPNKEVEGKTPLVRAVEVGSAKSVAQLLKAGADVNLISTTSDTALTHCIHCYRSGLAMSLLEEGASPGVESRSGGTPLLAAVD